MKQLLAALGNPHRRLRFVHIVGTNGKGSTTAMLASILRQAGYTVGANVSPYVLDFRERIQVNGEMIDEEALAQVLARVRVAAATLPEAPLEFEAVTAAALVYFADTACDLVCLEAGIGGAHDATNVVENTLVAVVTKIGLDHQELIGETVAAITAEKSGVFKNNCVVVSYPDQPLEAWSVIRQEAARHGCGLRVPPLAEVDIISADPFSQAARYRGLSFKLSLAGRHQVYNAAVAIEASFALREKGVPVPDAAIQQGLAAVRFPARIERLRRTPPVIVDGAHNADAAVALAQTLAAAGLLRLSGVAGFLRDKPVEEILQRMAPHLQTLYIVPPDNPRALPAEETKSIAGKYISNSIICNTIKDALYRAQQAGQGMVVFGSFYLAARARQLLLAQKDEDEQDLRRG